MTPTPAQESVRDVLAEMWRMGPAEFIDDYQDRIEAALEREQAAERRAFVQRATEWMAWVEPTKAPIPQMETANTVQWFEVASDRFNSMRDAYRAMLAAEKERGDA